VKVFELLNPDEGKNSKGNKGPQPKQMMRVGFSTAESPLLLGDAAGCVAFDADGTFLSGTTKTNKPGGKFGRDMVIAVLLNLDPKSPNANTVSLFRAGKRVSDPMPLPDDLKGKTLFPHISFRNLSVQVNFGKAQMAALPFSCRMVQDAAKKDTVEAAPFEGKGTVVFPVSLPDQGTFDWIDGWLADNPSFTELSDRKTMEWAAKSGVWMKKDSWSNSNDKPYFKTGLAPLDDSSASRVINSVVPCVPRDYVLMEVKQNLCAEDRAANLKKFSSDKFTKIARVAIGKPPKEFIAKVHKTMLEQKQTKLEGEWKQRKALKERQKIAEKKQKEMAERKKKAEEAMKKKAEEAAAKKAEEAAAKKAAEEAKAEGKEDAKEEAKDEAKEEAKEEPKKEEDVKKEEPETKEEPKEEPKEEAKEEAKEEEEEDEPMPVAELTDEEKAKWFKTTFASDLSSKEMSASFGKFSIPTKAEGFDEIVFDWSDEKASTNFVKDYVQKAKITSRIDDLKPGEWFNTTKEAFDKLSAECQAKTKKKEGEAEKKDEKPPPADVSEVENVHDSGDGTPIYKLFGVEDWALHSLRYELFLLAVAFKRDVDDPDRVGIHENHIAFYYGKYFKKSLLSKHYGKESIQDLLALVKDTVSLDASSGVMVLNVEEDSPADLFVKKQEEARRQRQRRIDAGDETARLDFSALVKQQEMAEKQAAHRASAPKAGAAQPAGKAPAQWANVGAQKGQGDKGWGKGLGKVGGKAWAPGKYGKKW